MRKILVAEDDPASRELLLDILSAWGYDVVEACDGGEALRKIEETGPDLVLLDIQMPVLDGFAVLRNSGRTPALPPSLRWRLRPMPCEATGRKLWRPALMPTSPSRLMPPRCGHKLSSFSTREQNLNAWIAILAIWELS